MNKLVSQSILKEVIRRSLRERPNLFPTSEQNSTVVSRLRGVLSVFQDYSIVGYSSFMDEVNLSSLGLEPLSSDFQTAIDQDPDVIVVPLYGQTTGGYRLGRGGGFYDKLLRKTGAIAIGAGIESRQVIFDPEPHDIRMDIIVTDKGIYSYL